MWLMLQQEAPDDYVIATGERHSVSEFARTTFEMLGLDWDLYVEIDPRYIRPAEVEVLEGDASKAREELGWEPRVRFHELVRMMVEADLEKAKEERTLVDAGLKFIEWPAKPRE